MKKNVTPGRINALVMRLRRYNEWRRGADFEQPEPTDVGADIDTAIELLELMCSSHIAKQNEVLR